MDYKEARAYIDGYTKSGGKVRDLSRAETLMAKLGDPQKNLKFVHIAGTNGKGSVLELMSQSLINAGLSSTILAASTYIAGELQPLSKDSLNISHLRSAF